jgi:GDP-L-fucose synthase
MNKNSRVYVAGHTGLVGSVLVRKLKIAGYQNIVTRTHRELDLTRQLDVEGFFAEEKPQYVFVAAARVGGIHANNTYPADFINDNLAIQQNIINAAYKNKTNRLLFLGSSCVYPRNCPQPMKEEYLLIGSLELTNRPYAIAKIAGIEQCWAYNRQYGTRFVAVMPTNLYGPHDNYDLENSHVLAALIRKIHQAKINNAPSVTVWGSGLPQREFLYVDDLADACLFLMNLPDEKYNKLLLNDVQPPLINIGWGKDISIKELVNLVKEIIGYTGNVSWDTSKPDGTPRKLLNIDKMNELGWMPKVKLREGIELAYNYYIRYEQRI